MGLAPIFVEKIFEIIVEINKQGTPILLVEQNALMALDVADRGYVLETGHDRARRRREGAARERAGAQDVPRRGLEQAPPTPQRKVRRREQEADPRRPAGAPVRHRQRRADAVRRDEAELAGGGRVAAAGDEHGAEPVERGLAGVPVGEREQRVARAAAAVGVDRARVGGGRALGVGERRRARGAVAGVAWKNAR